MQMMETGSDMDLEISKVTVWGQVRLNVQKMTSFPSLQYSAAHLDCSFGRGSRLGQGRCFAGRLSQADSISFIFPVKELG